MILKYIDLSKVGDRSWERPENSFSIAATPRCWGGRYSFPWIAPLYPWYVPSIWVLSKEVSSTILKVFGMTRPGIEPRSPRQLSNSLPIWPSLKKCYLIPPCLTLSILRYASRVKWSNPGNWVAPSLTPWCSSYWKRSLRVPLDYGRQH